MNAWLPHKPVIPVGGRGWWSWAGRVGPMTHLNKTGWGCYPCGNFSNTCSLKLLKTKGLIGHAFTVCIHTENQNQVSFYPFLLHEISILTELTLGHLRYHLTDVPPQPNSQRNSVFDIDWPAIGALILENEPLSSPPFNRISKKTIRVVVFHCCCCHLFYTSYMFSQSQTRVKLNRVFFPR